MEQIVLSPVKGVPLINQGDDLAEILFVLINTAFGFVDGDVLVIAQKVISKAEGAVVDLSTVTPSEQAIQIASQTGRDPRICQVFLDEAQEVIAIKGRMVITRHRLGYVATSSGVDRSNVAPHSEGKVVLLPKDPDQSARNIRSHILQRSGKRIAVIINDTYGRESRTGSVGMAIGIAGIGAIETRIKKDLFGNESRGQIALVDEISAAASILMGQADEGIPAVLVRGVSYTIVEGARIADFLL